MEKARKFMEYICHFWAENPKIRLGLEKGQISEIQEDSPA